MRYAELHARTHFTFLDGASSPADLVRRARELELPALAVTDKNGLYGVVETREALLEACGLRGRRREPETSPKLLYGSELSFDDDIAVAIAASREGYAQLGATITKGRLAAAKGEFILTANDLCERPNDLILLAAGPRSAAMRLLVEGDIVEAQKRLGHLKEAFGDKLYVELVRHLSPGDRERSLAMAQLAHRLKIPVVATNDVHFHAPQQKPLHDILRCIRLGVPLKEAGRLLLPNPEAHLKSAAQMNALFADLPDAIERTLEIVNRVDFRLCDISYHPPKPELPEGTDADTFLSQLAHEGLRAQMGADFAKYESKLHHELTIVRELGYAGYFLIMWEIVNVCRDKGILCQGRGSAANSLICFSLRITSVRPDVIDMLFERFLSKERDEPPDIDLDIEHERREEILQHVYEKYGRERAAMVCEVIRYRGRSAVNDVGKALGFSDEQLTRLSRSVARGWSTDRTMGASGLDSDNPQVVRLFDYAKQLINFPRHLSIHVGGFILSDEPLSRACPIENARMKDRTVLQWAKDDIDAMGMFKLDLLALGMLTAISRTFELVRLHENISLSLHDVPPEDPATYQMLRQADAIGVFQVESRAQMNMLPRLKPHTFYDLVIQVAIVRPGPIQGNMVHPYLRRRDGREAVDYPHPALEPILRRTLGVPLFQEQVMRLAEAVGGYTAGEADQLRRDMGKWNAEGPMERHRERLLAGMKHNGLSDEFAERVFQQIQGFGAYGFPESHAAAFARLSYVSAYLKRHHPAAFACALLNAQPMGFYSPSVLVSDVRRHDVEVRPIDVQRSAWDSSLEGRALRLGLHLVRGLGEQVGQRIAHQAPFASIEDLRHRAQVPKRALVSLAASGAFATLHDRRQALWEASAPELGPLFSGRHQQPNEPAPLPSLSPMEELALDVTHGSTFPGKHPMQLYREHLSRRGILRACDLAGAELDRQVKVAGLVITRQRPGQGKILYITLEDETGHADISVPLNTSMRFRDEVRARALVVRGRLSGTSEVRNIVASHLEPLGALPSAPSHDYR